MLSWKEVEEQLVAAVKLSWRLPSGSRSAFATDGPWLWLTQVARASAGVSDRPGAAEWEAWRQEIEAQQLRDLRNNTRTVPLTAREVDWMESRLAWLLLVPESDRKLVWVALVEIAAARGRISWRRIRAKLEENRRWREVSVSSRGLGQRYSRAIATVTKAVNAAAAKRAA